MKTVVFINEFAAHGTARSKWSKIEASVLKSLDSKAVVKFYSPPFSFLKNLDSSDVETVLIGGGDGSIHQFINELMEVDKSLLERIKIGAIGLGSSNDFHKPFNNLIGKIPIRIQPSNDRCDIGKITIRNEEKIKVKYFIINASLGITAYGNHLFNNPDFLLRTLKSGFTGLAINYAALKSVLTYSNETIYINSALRNGPIVISNINIIKNPHISGGLRYDQKIKKDDGKLGLHICEDMNKLELIKTFIDLGKGTFSGKPKRSSSFEKEIIVEADSKIPVELDGEIYLGDKFKFEVLNKQVHLLT